MNNWSRPWAKNTLKGQLPLYSTGTFQQGCGVRGRGREQGGDAGDKKKELRIRSGRDWWPRDSVRCFYFRVFFLRTTHSHTKAQTIQEATDKKETPFPLPDIHSEEPKGPSSCYLWFISWYHIRCTYIIFPWIKLIYELLLAHCKRYKVPHFCMCCIHFYLFR